MRATPSVLLAPFLLLLAACGTPPPEQQAKRPVRQPVPAATSRANSPQPAAAKATAGSSPPAAPDSLWACPRPHPLQFRRIRDEDLRQDIAIGNILVDTLLKKFLVTTEHNKPALLYYHPAAHSSDWIEARLELPGEWLWNQEVTLDTVRLAPHGPPALLVKFSSESYLRHWSTANQGLNLIDIAHEPPLLVLKAGTYSHESGYTGDDEQDTTDAAREEHSFSVIQEQEIKVRKQRIIVSPATEDGQYDLQAVAAGTYRYHKGKLVRVGK